MAVEIGDKFQFPDEKGELEEKEKKGLKFEFVVEGEDDTNIEIVDDTPDKDKGRQKLEKFIEPTDEELAAYGKDVQARIKAIDHARHDERREKEAAARERDEAAEFARQVLEENKRLKSYVQTGEKAFVATSKAAAQSELAMAEAEFKAAHEAYDTDALLAAQKKLNAAQMKLAAAENFRSAPLQADEEGVERQPSQQALLPKPDGKTARWQARNQWFGVDDEMTALALAVHKKLVGERIDPTSDEYFERIDARMQEKFPEVLGRSQSSADERSQQRQPAKKPANVVASATRSSGAKKITLTQTQVALAKKLGLTNEQYAQSVAQLEQQNGR